MKEEEYKAKVKAKFRIAFLNYLTFEVTKKWMVKTTTNLK
jgi:hypothetical protein